MQQKNIFLMLALSGSVLMVMLVSTLLFIPHTSSLEANMILNSAPESVYRALPEPDVDIKKPEQIIQTIQEYVANNDPDTAKKLYEVLYRINTSEEIKPMGGEVSGEVNTSID